MRNILLTVILVFCFANQSFAATTIVRHVDKDCATNGDGTVASPCASGGAGSTGPYNSWSNAEADVNSDYSNFVSSDVVVQVQLHAGADDTTAVFIDGMTMDATRYLEFVCDPGYVITASADHTIRIGDTHVKIRGCTIKQTGGNSCIRAESGVAGGIIDIVGNKLLGGGKGFFTNTGGNSTTFNVIKNFMWDHTSTGVDYGNGGTSGQVLNLYNNTIYPRTNTNDAIVTIVYGSSDTLNMYNNVFNNCVSNHCWYDEGGWTTQNSGGNITEDTKSPQAGGDNKTCSFVDTATGDLHLQSGDTNCKDFGTDMSADAQYPFSTDIDGDTMGTWPAGADEPVASSDGSEFTTLKILGYY